MELQKYVIDYLPRAIWDNGAWFKFFNKSVEENEIPVDEDVLGYMMQNQRLYFEYAMGGAIQRRDGTSDEEAMGRAAVIKLKGVDIDGKGDITPSIIDVLPPDADARQIYEIFTGRNVGVTLQ